MRVLNVALDAPRLGKQTAPNPEQQYSQAEYMQWVPSTGTAARQFTFVANFVGTTFLPATNLGKVQLEQARQGVLVLRGGRPYHIRNCNGILLCGTFVANFVGTTFLL